MAGRFAADPALAVLSFRVTDPGGGFGGRWHVPRLRVGDPSRSAPATTFSGGACAIRRSAYLEVGGQPGSSSSCTRRSTRPGGCSTAATGSSTTRAAVMCHPPVPNSRHAGFYRIEARNRVLLARRNLPWPLAALFLLDWLGADRRADPVLAGGAGVAGRRSRRAGGWTPGPRQPLAARTVWRMTRLGRPPVI